MNLRADIQCLRAAAVLLVICYHARLGVFPAGYLGVDIFFVISGYLITGLIIREINEGSFSPKRFYIRRAQRLLPASLVTLVATSALAPMLLTKPVLREYLQSLLGALTFSSNVVFWRQDNYFGTYSTLKPILHFWSLSLEEQYYFFIPWAFLLAPKRFWLPGAVMGFLASLAATLWIIDAKPVAAFYLLPFRAWELAAGSIGALAAPSRRLQAICELLLLPAVAALVIIPMFPIGLPDPGANALIVTAATFAILTGKANLTGRWVSWPAKLGDISYSVYLVHWPFFAFAANLYVADVPLWLCIAGILFSLLGGWALHVAIERPYWKGNLLPSDVLVKRICVLIVAGITTTVIALAQSSSDLAGGDWRSANHGLSPQCEQNGAFDRPPCQTGPNPEILVWGDSFAMHIVPGLVASTSHAIVQATKSDCASLINAALADKSGGHGLARRCIEFNETVMSSLRKTTSIKVVVLSSRYHAFFPVLGQPDRTILTETGDLRADGAVLIKLVASTVSELRAMGKRVILVAPPPVGTFNMGRCLERLADKLVTIDAPFACDINRNEYHSNQRELFDFFNHLASVVPVVNFDNFLCDNSVCRTKLNEIPLYRDQGHLTQSGSIALAKGMGLGELVWEHSQ
jgi:peptidoglycan/LPS O-acetylase OafA/YrhL